MNAEWKCKHFKDLLPYELYAIIRLRIEVFVIEQNCVYQDCDNKDQDCYHLCGWVKDELVAYTRLVPPGFSYSTPSIGRVITSSVVRRTGMGKKLMQLSISKIIELFGQKPITISAQFYLKQFYRSLGFQQVSDVYPEDGIDHIRMIYNP